MLTAEIFTNPLYQRCSNGGASETHRKVTIVNASGPAAVHDDAPPVLIESHGPGILRAVPAMEEASGAWKPAPGWHMMGGAYIASSDSRLTELCETLLRQSYAKALAGGALAELRAAHDKLEKAGVGVRWYGAIPLHDRTER